MGSPRRTGVALLACVVHVWGWEVIPHAHSGSGQNTLSATTGPGSTAQVSLKDTGGYKIGEPLPAGIPPTAEGFALPLIGAGFAAPAVAEANKAYQPPQTKIGKDGKGVLGKTFDAVAPMAAGAVGGMLAGAGGAVGALTGVAGMAFGNNDMTVHKSSVKAIHNWDDALKLPDIPEKPMSGVTEESLEKARGYALETGGEGGGCDAKDDQCCQVLGLGGLELYGFDSSQSKQIVTAALPLTPNVGWFVTNANTFLDGESLDVMVRPAFTHIEKEVQCSIRYGLEELPCQSQGAYVVPFPARNGGDSIEIFVTLKVLDWFGRRPFGLPNNNNPKFIYGSPTTTTKKDGGNAGLIDGALSSVTSVLGHGDAATSATEVKTSTVTSWSALPMCEPEDKIVYKFTVARPTRTPFSYSDLGETNRVIQGGGTPGTPYCISCAPGSSISGTRRTVQGTTYPQTAVLDDEGAQTSVVLTFKIEEKYVGSQIRYVWAAAKAEGRAPSGYTWWGGPTERMELAAPSFIESTPGELDEDEQEELKETGFLPFEGTTFKISGLQCNTGYRFMVAYAELNGVPAGPRPPAMLPECTYGVEPQLTWKVKTAKSYCANKGKIEIHDRMPIEECKDVVRNKRECGFYFSGRDGGDCTCVRAGEDCEEKPSKQNNDVYTYGIPDPKKDDDVKGGDAFEEIVADSSCSNANIEMEDTLSVKECMEMVAQNDKCGGIAHARDRLHKKGGKCACVPAGETCEPKTAKGDGSAIYAMKGACQGQYGAWSAASPIIHTKACNDPMEQENEEWSKVSPGSFCKNRIEIHESYLVSDCKQVVISKMRRGQCGDYMVARENGDCSCVKPGEECEFTPSKEGNDVWEYGITDPKLKPYSTYKVLRAHSYCAGDLIKMSKGVSAKTCKTAILANKECSGTFVAASAGMLGSCSCVPAKKSCRLRWHSKLSVYGLVQKKQPASSNAEAAEAKEMAAVQAATSVQKVAEMREKRQAAAAGVAAGVKEQLHRHQAFITMNKSLAVNFGANATAGVA